MKNEKAKEKLIEDLKDLLPVGTKIYTILRHVSKSGMQRQISAFFWDDELHDMREISYNVAQILGRRINDKSFGVVCNGTGMDMGFEMVYSLAQTLYGCGKGYSLKQQWL